MDETDRLLKQSYQEWLPRVLEELSERHHSTEWAEAVASVEDDAGPALRTSQLPYSQHRWVESSQAPSRTPDPPAANCARVKGCLKGLGRVSWPSTPPAGHLWDQANAVW